MRLLIKHEFPRRLRRAQVYLEFLNASLYVSVDGPSASVMGSIGTPQRRAMAISDRQYASYRASHEVAEVLDEDDERVILKTVDGQEEEWIRPKWILNGVRRARPAMAAAHS